MVAKTQAGEVKQWLDETRLLIRAAELLVEWFSEEGSEIDEYAAFKESLDLPHKNLGLIDEWLRVGDTAPDRVNKWTARQFCAGEEVARAVSPLLERVVVYRPTFVGVRKEDEPLPKVTALWGQFIGNFGTYVCAPLWKAHPDCAPPDWFAR